MIPIAEASVFRTRVMYLRHPDGPHQPKVRQRPSLPSVLMADGFSLHERAESLRRSAEADLAQAAGDRSLCVIAKSGKSFPMVKYHEGRAAALSMVIRSARSDTGDRVALDETRRRFEAMTKLAAEDPDWEAYRHGALEAVDQLEVS